MRLRRPLAWMLFLAGLAAIVGRAGAAPPAGAISLAAYWQQVGATRALVARLQGTSAADQHAQLVRTAGEWAKITEIILPDGQRQPVSTTFLASQLSANPPDLVRLQALLGTLQNASDQWPAVRSSPADLATLSAILADPEFAAPDNTQAQLLDQLWQRFVNWVLSWLPHGQGATSLPAASLFQWLCVGIAALGLLLVLVYAFRGIFTNFIAEAEASRQTRAGEEVVTAESALRQAQRLSAAGDYRPAVRYLYLTALLTLEERGLLHYNRSQTNREYLRSVAQRPELAARLRGVVEVFDGVWYGFEPIDAARYQDYAARVAELERER